MINGKSLIGLTHGEAVDVLRHSPKLVQLVVATKVRSHCQGHTVKVTLSKSHCQGHTVKVTLSRSHCQSHTVKVT